MKKFLIISTMLVFGLTLLVGVYACSDDEDKRKASGGTGDENGNGDGNGGGNTDANSCRFVDVVIAVDGSISMDMELEAMRTTVFPAFAAQLGSIADGLDDFRIATLDGCPNPANFHTRGVNGECGFQGGNAWINSNSPSMNAEFACVGDIFLQDVQCSGNNDDEQPSSAIITALESPWSDNENAGFLRPDALLVVIAITDEDEQSTVADSARTLYQRLVDLKGGDPEKIVFLGIGGNQQCTGAYGDADQARTLHQLTDLFIAENRGVWWDLCQGRLEDGLQDAFDIIQVACEEFSPPIV